jgi:hypothetical protein
MAHHHLNSNNNNNRRTSIVAMPINNQIVNDSYDYELMKLMEQERQFMVAQVCIWYLHIIFHISFEFLAAITKR